MDGVEKIIKETVMAEMIRSAQAAGMPKKFIDHIHIKKRSKYTYHIINDWKGPKGEPLAVYFEFGTDRHWIEPKSHKGVLAFPAPDKASQKHAKAIYYKGGNKKPGEMVFSKGHYVSGIAPLEPMSRGFDIGVERMKEALGNTS